MECPAEVDKEGKREDDMWQAELQEVGGASPSQDTDAPAGEAGLASLFPQTDPQTHKKLITQDYVLPVIAPNLSMASRTQSGSI